MRTLVTGGGGFLGSAIVRALRTRGDTVRSFSRGWYSTLEELGVEQVQGDLNDKPAVLRAVEGCDLVFHVAAKAGIWGKYADYQRTNVLGTANVLAGCRKHGVQRLVYTSSPSVVFNGKDMEGIDENAPYPDRFEAHYPCTKAQAEQLVTLANTARLATVSLRPHLIWGPGDNHLIPRILKRARAGRLRRIGNNNKLIDTIYIDNAADAHLLAADRLNPGGPIAGKVYFVSNGEPWPIWDLINAILACADLPPVKRRIPVRLARGIGWLFEAVYGLCRIQREPPMTRFLARELSTAHWFDLSNARRDLGYTPRVTIREGLERLRVWLRQSADSVLAGAH
jgi:nucleoside-diphosphate-sugar epimerase